MLRNKTMTTEDLYTVLTEPVSVKNAFAIGVNKDKQQTYALLQFRLFQRYLRM